jgi:hypothetical protein
MSYQPPISQPPIINQTQTNTTITNATLPPQTLPPQAGLTDILMLFREPWFLAVLTAVVAGVVAIIMLVRGRRGGGTPSFTRALKTKGDAYAIVIDLNTRTVFMTSMRRLSPYRYMFTKGNAKYLFIPIYNKPFIIEGATAPCFIAVSGGPSLALELDPSISLSLGLATSTPKEGLSSTEKIRDLIDKLVAQISSGTTTYTSEIPSIPEVSFEVSIPKFLTSLYMATADTIRSLLIALTDAWTSIEEMAKTLKAEKYAGLPHLGRFLVYLGVFALILIIALWLASYFGVFGGVGVR